MLPAACGWGTKPHESSSQTEASPSLPIPPLAGNPEPAIAMLSAALSGVWPPSRPMQRRLVARQFVPTAEAGEEQSSTNESAGEVAAATEAGSAAPAGTAAGEGAGPSSSSSSQEGGPSSSAAAAEGQAAAAARQEEEQEGEEQANQLAAALGAALEKHCPGLRLADVEKAALCLRLFLGCRAVGEQASDGPNFQVGRAKCFV